MERLMAPHVSGDRFGPTQSPPVLDRPVTSPREEETTRGTDRGDWLVVVYDNDYNTFDEVIAILMIATGCTLEEAYIETWEVHHLGKSIVHSADEKECRQVARIIATIGIRVEVCPDPIEV